MPLLRLAVVTLVSLHWTGGSISHPELNPELGKYQDEGPQCFPLTETWYMVYRNYESDPVFGGTAGCLRYTQEGPMSNGTVPLVIRYGNDAVYATGFLASSPGYTAENIIGLKVQGRTDSQLLYDSYVDCSACAVRRMSYVNENACALFSPESHMVHDTRCCDFIFDLLCGSSPKYFIFNKSC
ncbi:unnamed protein product, partial [Ixodes hexagonus]